MGIGGLREGMDGWIWCGMLVGLRSVWFLLSWSSWEVFEVGLLGGKGRSWLVQAVDVCDCLRESRAGQGLALLKMYRRWVGR